MIVQFIYSSPPKNRYLRSRITPWWAVYPTPFLMKRNFNIQDHPNLIEEINAIVNNNEVAEVKAEFKEGKISYKVVKIVRKVTASSN